MRGRDDHECQDPHHDDEGEGEGAEGAAVFPLIPAELGINPILLALVHSMVFVDGSTDEVIDPEGAEEAMHYIVTYLQRLEEPALSQVHADLDRLIAYAKKEGWPKEQTVYLKSFLSDYGLTETA
jgi:hypothetical protein